MFNIYKTPKTVIRCDDSIDTHVEVMDLAGKYQIIEKFVVKLDHDCLTTTASVTLKTSWVINLEAFDIPPFNDFTQTQTKINFIQCSQHESDEFLENLQCPTVGLLHPHDRMSFTNRSIHRREC